MPLERLQHANLSVEMALDPIHNNATMETELVALPIVCKTKVSSALVLLERLQNANLFVETGLDLDRNSVIMEGN